MANSGAVVLKPVGKSNTSPKEQKQGKVCYVDVFKLTDLPNIMDKKGWKVSAAIMRKWLNNSAYTMSLAEKRGETDSRLYPANLVDTSEVKMSWALSFPRIKEEHDKIFGSKGFFRSTPAEYESPKAKSKLIQRLATAGKFTRQTESFGNLRDSVLNINEQWQFQYHRIGSWAFNAKSYSEAAINDTFRDNPDFDDMWGALATCFIQIACEGIVTPKTKIIDTGIQCAVQVEYYEVSVNQIGTYFWDTYDFNGDQYLGHWSKTSPPYIRLYSVGESRGDCPDDFVEVNNERFRAHRTKTGKGGDLLIFSDVLVTSLRKPFTFRVTPQEVQAITGSSK